MKPQSAGYDLGDLRASLDNIDAAMVALLAERFRVTYKVGVYKRDNGLPIVDTAREAIQFARIETLAKEAGLDPAVARAVLRVIIDNVYVHHQAIAEA